MLAGPAMAPPVGVMPNFIDPPSTGPVLVDVGAVLVAIMVVFVAIRIITKASISHKVTWDDCMQALSNGRLSLY